MLILTASFKQQIAAPAVTAKKTIDRSRCVRRHEGDNFWGADRVVAKEGGREFNLFFDQREKRLLR